MGLLGLIGNKDCFIYMGNSISIFSFDSNLKIGNPRILIAMIIKKNITITAWVVLSIFFIAYVSWALISRNRLEKNHLFAVGIVTGYTYGGRGNADMMTVEF